MVIRGLRFDLFVLIYFRVIKDFRVFKCKISLKKIIKIVVRLLVA